MFLNWFILNIFFLYFVKFRAWEKIYAKPNMLNDFSPFFVRVKTSQRLLQANFNRIKFWTVESFKNSFKKAEWIVQVEDQELEDCHLCGKKVLQLDKHILANHGEKVVDTPPPLPTIQIDKHILANHGQKVVDNVRNPPMLTE